MASHNFDYVIYILHRGGIVPPTNFEFQTLKVNVLSVKQTRGSRVSSVAQCEPE